MTRQNGWTLVLGIGIVGIYLVAIVSEGGASVPHWIEVGPDSYWCVTRQASTELQMEFMKLVMGLATAAIALQVTFRERVLGEENGKSLVIPLKFQLSAVSFLLAVAFSASYQGFGANIIRESCAPKWSLALETQLQALRAFCNARNEEGAIPSESVASLLKDESILELTGTNDWQILRSALASPRHAKDETWDSCKASEAKFSVPKDAKLTHETSTARLTYLFAIVCFILGSLLMVGHVLRGK